MMQAYPNDTELHRITKREIVLKSRDNARTPMQWDTSAHAGFSSSTPWQCENESYKTINAASQVGIKNSVFEYWASILKIRKEQKDIFIYGNFEMVDVENKDVFAHLRSFSGEKVLVVANFRKEGVVWNVPRELELVRDRLLVSNYGGIEGREGLVDLRPFEAFACFVK